jgi:hypothetical protein
MHTYLWFFGKRNGTILASASTFRGDDPAKTKAYQDALFMVDDPNEIIAVRVDLNDAARNLDIKGMLKNA